MKLRVWWIPQIGMKAEPFQRQVENVKEGWKLINVLADYDLYQYENKVKPDYSNAGGLEMLDEDGEWVEWQDITGSNLNDIENWLEENQTMVDYFNQYGVNGQAEFA